MSDAAIEHRGEDSGTAESTQRPGRPRTEVQEAVLARQKHPARHFMLYVGLGVLVCQLVFVYAFFPSFDAAAASLVAGDSAKAVPGGGKLPAVESKYSQPDLLQWSGAQSLVWIASLFAPETPVRMAPALVFFLVAGGFLSALCRRGPQGGVGAIVAVSARGGMRLWLTWFAGAAILLVYILTSAGGMKALRVAAGITFDRPGRDIADAFLAHWLIYIAWFVLLGFLPMVGGGLLGLVRTRLFTAAVRDDDEPAQAAAAGTGDRGPAAC